MRAAPLDREQPLSATALFLITTALAGIGLSLHPAALRHTGGRPLLLGALLWIAVASTSLILQAIPTPTSSNQGAVPLWPGRAGAFIARTRSLRARATRERMVPIGHLHTSAAAA